jgi:cellulose synthase/poly-beta-1,6-N-acetylglucosamine synthase-like glycosyltransferase
VRFGELMRQDEHQVADQESADDWDMEFFPAKLPEGYVNPASYGGAPVSAKPAVQRKRFAGFSPGRLAVKVRDRIRQSRPFPAITVPLPELSALTALPTVSVVIPCKGNEKTIRATVEALLRQDYPALIELILVGDVDDSTWTVLRDITDRRLVLLEQEKTPGRRDPNIKRAKGLRYASGQVLALADSDIVMDPDWLSQGVRLLYLQGSGLVAGGMRSVVDTFWGRFVDKNALAAKTPRIPQPYNVTAVNFGKKGFKPPITANAVFTRDLYNKCPLDTEWAYGYEDYEWFWRVARNGHSILYSDDLTAAHHHRSSFKKLLREYRQSSHGCARFVLVHHDSPLAKKRLEQAITLPLVALAALAGVGAVAAMGYGLYVLAAIVLGGGALVGKEVATSKSLEAALYPPLSILLGLTFTFNLGYSLTKMRIQEPELRRSVPEPESAPLPTPEPSRGGSS